LNNSIPAEELSPDQLRQLVISCLEDLKAIDVQVIDVRGVSPLTEMLVIASGNSTRHVKGMAEKIIQRSKAVGCQPLGVEGEREGEWILVDLNDVIVHLMLPQTRAFYNLEKLWEVSAGRRSGKTVPA
jgi:ribosome-associated protein